MNRKVFLEIKNTIEKVKKVNRRIDIENRSKKIRKKADQSNVQIISIIKI